MTIRYQINAVPTAEQMSTVFKSSGIKRPVDDLERLQRMIDNADIIATAWDGEDLVGIARAITDFAYCCYLSDLAVAKAYQRSGIGQELVRQVQERIGECVSLILISAPTAVEYYPHLGFEKLDKAFAIPRKR